MERRDRSLKALARLKYIDSLEESSQKAMLLSKWIEEYLTNTPIEDFVLVTKDLELLSELFYKNIIFLKQYRVEIKTQLDSKNQIKQFLQ